MTVSSTTAKVSYSGNGSTTAFTVSFYFLTTSDLKVTLRKADGSEIVKTLSTDYTVTGAGVTSGGTVTMVTAPASGETLVIQRNVPFTQLVDYQPNDPFPANTHEQALDKLTMEIQQLNEALARAIKVSTTNTITSVEFTVDATTRALKVLSFDAAGELSVTQELGTFKGNWASGSAYKQRDLIKDTSNGNIYICVTAHTSSGAQPISSNTDSAKWSLIVDAASATTSASAAATSASAAASSASAAATSASNASSSASSASTSAGTATTQASNASSSASAASTSATNAATSATNAGNSATSASNSAAAAAASAASGLYSAVQDKSANYTVVAGDAGDLLRISTGSGAVTITLPQISTVSDGFKIAIVKWTGDTNAVTIARSGSDTINGASSAAIGSQYTQTTFVADFETNQWFAATSGLGSTNVVTDVFSGNGSTTAFTLSGDPGAKNNTYVHIGGVYQQKSTYSLSGTTLTFSAAPPSGTSNIEVVWTQPLAVGVPSDGTVNYAKLSADVQGAIYGFKNRIINGAMGIWQRGTSGFTTNPNYASDRWIVGASTSLSAVAQSSDVPAGFKYSLSVAGTNFPNAIQRIESLNCTDLGSQTVTISFWLKQSSGAGANSIGLALYYANSADNFAGGTTQIGSASLITATSSWAQYTATFSSISANAVNGLQIQIYANTAGAATFLITGVQLEKGSTATSFDYRPYGTELALCFRYFRQYSAASNPLTNAMIGYGLANSSTQIYRWGFMMDVSMRAYPTITFSSGVACWAGSNVPAATASTSYSNPNYVDMDITTTGLTFTANGVAKVYFPTTAEYVRVSAEL